MLGWDFLFSVANTTPSKALSSSPMENAPENIVIPTEKNKWNTMTYKERIPYVQKWWNLIADVLPFEPWRSAWQKAENKYGKAQFRWFGRKCGDKGRISALKSATGVEG
jgi:hypothetical protein